MLWTQPRAGEIDTTQPGEAARLTMIVLSATGNVDAAEADFYRDAELQMLSEGAAQGLIVLAFAPVERDQLILFSAEAVERVLALVAELPFVAAGLATPVISEVRVVRPVAVQS